MYNLQQCNKQFQRVFYYWENLVIRYLIKSTNIVLSRVAQFAGARAAAGVLFEQLIARANMNRECIN